MARGRPAKPRDADGNIIRSPRDKRYGESREAWFARLADMDGRDIPLPSPIAPIAAPKPAPQSKESVWEYSSVQEFVQDAQSFEPTDHNRRLLDDNGRESGRSYDWMGFDTPHTIKQVDSLINSGWNEGAEKLSTLSEGISSPEIDSVKRRVLWTDQGDELDMARVYSGQSDQAWRTTRRRNTRQPRFFHIAVELFHTARIESAHMFYPGAAALVLADLLTQAGHQVKISAIMHARNAGTDEGKNAEILTAIVGVKDYADPVNLASLAASTALPAFFRMMGISWSYRHYRKPSEMGCNYHVEIPASIIPADDQTQVFVASNKVLDLRAARQWIVDSLKSLESI